MGVSTADGNRLIGLQSQALQQGKWDEADYESIQMLHPI